MPRIISDFFIAFTLFNPSVVSLEPQLSLAYSPNPSSVSIHRTARIPNELFNQVVRCMKANIIRKPPRIELSGKDARETGD